MASPAVLVVVVLLVAAGAGGVGFVAGYDDRLPSGGGPSAAANSTLSLLAAGALVPVFPQLADELVNETPGISAPAAAQTYEGSLDVTTGIAALHQRADVAAVADYRLIPPRLEPGSAGYEVVFGSTPEVLAYDPAVPAFRGVNSTNWADRLVEDVSAPGDAPFAVWNASSDPNGYNEIFSLELQGLLEHGSATAYLSTFYGGSPGHPAVPRAGTTRVEKESQAAALLGSGVVSALITYRAYAVANRLAFVPFDPIVGLVANGSAAFADYAELSTVILDSNGSLSTVTPAPVLFAATVPLDAPDPALGAAFLHLLLSPKGSALLSAGGAFTPIYPGWTDRPGSVPPELAPDVTGLPGWATLALG